MSTDTKTKDDATLRMERIIAASPERLFELWTEPEELVKWWGPEGFTTPKQAMDVRPGGRWRTTMRSPDGKNHTVSGIYRAIEPPKRLVAFEKVWLAPGERKVVTMTLDPAAANHPLGVWDEAAQRWRVPNGRYTITVGTSAADARLKESVTIGAAGRR